MSKNSKILIVLWSITTLKTTKANAITVKTSNMMANMFITVFENLNIPGIYILLF